MKCKFGARIKKFAASKNGYDVTLHVTSGLLEDCDLAALAQATIDEHEFLNVEMESIQSELPLKRT